MAICNLPDFLPLIPKGKCLLGLDPGRAVIGVAISDPDFRVASPLTGLVRKKLGATADQLLQIVQERSIGGLVVGLPKNMDGTEGPSAQSARTLVVNLLRHPGFPDLPILFWDERLSTAAVERFMISDEMSRKRRDEVVDKMAAAYILQGALDRLGSLAASTSPAK